MKSISDPAAASSSRSSSSGGSPAHEVKPDGDSGTLDRWDRRLLGGFMAGVAIALVATALLLWSVGIKKLGVSIDVLGYVAAGGIGFSFLMLSVMDSKDRLTRLRGTQQTASDLV